MTPPKELWRLIANRGHGLTPPQKRTLELVATSRLTWEVRDGRLRIVDPDSGKTINGSVSSLVRIGAVTDPAYPKLPELTWPDGWTLATRCGIHVASTNREGAGRG